MNITNQDNPIHVNQPETSPEIVIDTQMIRLKRSALVTFGLFLVIFLMTGFSLLMFFQNQSLKNQLGLPTFKFPWMRATCSYEGQTYKVGESVPSIDGCNSCSCDESGQVACTDMACEVSEQVVQNDLDSWRRFANNAFHYTFKYPPDWEINYGKTAGKVVATSEDVAQATYVSLFKPDLSSINRPDGKVMGIDIVFNANVLSPQTEEAITCKVIDSQECIEKLRSIIGSDAKMEIMSLDSYKAISIEGPAMNKSFSSKFAYVLNQGKIFEISLTTNNVPMDKALLNTFTEILNTLSFSSSNSSKSEELVDDDLPSEVIKYSPKSDWQTYADEIAGFSIQYPDQHKVNEAATQKGNRLNVLACGFPDPKGGEDLCLSGFSISIHSNYTGGSRRAWLQENLNAYKPYYMNWIIDGKNSLVAIDGNPGGSSSLNILIPHGKQMFVFMVSGVTWDPDTGKVPDLTYEKSVLSTFKTID